MKDVKRAWQRMLSGRRLDLLDPSPLDIELEDIAHGLARVARWNGPTSGAAACSVAKHSLLVDEIAGRLKPVLTAAEHTAAARANAAENVLRHPSDRKTVVTGKEEYVRDSHGGPRTQKTK